MTNNDVLPQLLTIEQLAGRLGVSIRHIRRLIAERRVPYLKVGWFRLGGLSASTRPRSLPGLMMLATLTSGTGGLTPPNFPGVVERRLQASCDHDAARSSRQSANRLP
jgi:excisionase family DNA binding protein